MQISPTRYHLGQVQSSTRREGRSEPAASLRTSHLSLTAAALALVLNGCGGPPPPAPAAAPVEPAAAELPVTPEPEPRPALAPPRLMSGFALQGQSPHQYHLSSANLEVLTRTSLTADQLAPDAPHLTARGVDPSQASKTYPYGPNITVLSQSFVECTATDYLGNCRQTAENLIVAKTVECNYQDEKTGESVRVLQYAPFHMRTPQMDIGVCGGHRLVPDEWGAAPAQTDAAGHTLYLNPAHIITILPR